ncbi:MAG TPA: peptidoglycan DD-metalloendopeptidase family protein [Candidatus Stackebrandtia excrementipullorum]|nr:peptidoglycan DD-metalloendopeptidase family protein [Candidatus Stackebrandtia excrementipullorum]
MKRPNTLRRRLMLLATAVVTMLATMVVTSPANAAGPRPDFRSPWPCGESRQYYHHSSEVYNALDFSLPGGADFNTPALATAPGTAHVHSGGGYGNYVVIHHGGGWTTLTAHLHSVSVSHGQYVTTGQEIGRVGSTGNSTGPHLHYEQTADGANQRIILDGVALRYSPAISHHTSGNCGGSGDSLAGQAYLVGHAQHFVGVTPSGNLTDISWSPSAGVTDQNFGGDIVGQPFGYFHDDLQHVFARGTNDTLLHWFRSGNATPGLDHWGTEGKVKSDPTGFAYRTQQHVFFRNPDGNLEHRWYDAADKQVRSGVWPGGEFVGNPYAFVHKDQQHVFARTADGGLKHWYWWPGIEPGVDDWGITSGVASDITGFSYGNQHHIFFRNTDGHLQHRFFNDPSGTLDGGVWAGGEFVGDPHAFVHGDQQHIFGRTADGDLIHWYWWPGIEPSYDNWGAVGVVAGDPVGLSVGGQHHVFYRSNDGTLGHRFMGADGLVVDDWGGNLRDDR